MNYTEKLQDIIREECLWIHSQYERLEDVLSALAKHEKSLGVSEERSLNKDYWFNIYNRNALIRSCQFLQHNIIGKELAGTQKLETMGVLITMRYLIELRIWGRLIEGDDSYAYSLYFRRMSEQRKQHDRFIDFLAQSIEFIKNTGKFRSKARITARASLKGKVKTKRRINSRVEELVESEYRRKGFIWPRVYSSMKEDFLIKNLQTNIDDTRANMDSNSAAVDSDRKIIHQDYPDCEKGLHGSGWRWEEKAKHVRMHDEYRLLYSGASDQLHAGPFSFINDLKELEAHEYAQYISHIRFSFEEILDRATRFVGSGRDQDKSYN